MRNPGYVVGRQLYARRFTGFLGGWWLACGLAAAGAVSPVPEAEQAALALKILAAYHGVHPPTAHKLLHVFYFTPSDRDPEPQYRERLQGVLEDIQSFYRDGMARAGFGQETFGLARDSDGRLIIHLVKGAEPESFFKRSGFKQDEASDNRSRATIDDECRPVMKAAGIDPDVETVVIFCNLAKWDAAAKKFSHHSPYMGIWDQKSGLCFAVDSVILDAANLTNREPRLQDKEWGEESLGKFNTIFIGGIAHELGHAFSLSHCGARRDEAARGVSLMGSGNHNYREELRSEGPGAFLPLASTLKLAGRPLFSQCDKGLDVPPKLIRCELQFSTILTRPDLVGRPDALRLEGVVEGEPPVYGVIAYFDSAGDGGYHAPTTTAVPDAAGRFALEISDLQHTRKGQLTVQFCHANGADSARQMTFEVSGEAVDLRCAQMETALEALGSAVVHGDKTGAQRELQKLEDSQQPELVKRIGRSLAATLQGEPKLSPAEAPPSVTKLALGDAKAEVAKVGWFEPAANRIPANRQVASPLLDCDGLYATGLFAHAPSQYVFDLGGRWKQLRGEAGLHTSQQPFGSVDFRIKADGKVVFQSATIRGAVKATYDVDVTHVQKLELIVGDAGDGNGNDWGLWLDPTLSR